MREEEEVKRRVRVIFDMRNVTEMSRRTGYKEPTLRSWKKDPLRIKAVDLLRLERKVGIK